MLSESIYKACVLESIVIVLMEICKLSLLQTLKPHMRFSPECLKMQDIKFYSFERLLKLIYYFMCMRVCLHDVWAPHVCLVAVEARRGLGFLRTDATDCCG